MDDQAKTPHQSNVVDRIKRLLLTPRIEWPAIDAEPMTTAQILKGWVLPLAAIGPVAALVGGQLFGFGAFGITFRPSLASGLSMAVTSYVLSIAGAFVLAAIFNALAPSFQGRKDFLAAFKLSAFAATAAWIAGIFQLLPGLWILGLLGLYSLYLLYVGAPVLMRLPAEKAMGFTIAAVVASIVVFLVAGAISASVGRSFVAGPGLTAGSDTISGSVTVPGVGSLDLGKMEEASRRMEEAAKRAEAGESNAADPAILQAMLPASLGGWQRTEMSTSGASAGMIGGSQAEARYSNAGQSFRLSVTDIAAMGGLAAMAGAMNVQSSRQTETGYERTATVDGRLTTEEWDNSGRGKFGVMVASRFMVEAEGEAPDVGTLKRAVTSIDLNRLEAMAR